MPVQDVTLVACRHGSDGPDSCFGCAYGTPGWPVFSEPVRRRYEVRYSATFVAQMRVLGARRFPLRATRQ